MLSAQAMRGKFKDHSLETASNERIVVMIFDRIQRDLTEAASALQAADHHRSHTALNHAQALVSGLQMMLDADAWQHAADLDALYDYVLRLLVRANITKSVEPVVEAQGLMADLGDAFRGAAIEVARTGQRTLVPAV